MRAARAHIAGLGIAGSLLAGAAVLFVLAAGIESFQGWPQLDGHGAQPSTVVAGATPTVSSPATRRVAALLASQGLSAPHPINAALRIRTGARRRGSSSAGAGGRSSAQSASHARTPALTGTPVSASSPRCVSSCAQGAGGGSSADASQPRPSDRLTGSLGGTGAGAGSAVGTTSSLSNKLASAASSAAGVVDASSQTAQGALQDTSNAVRGNAGTVAGATASLLNDH